MWCRPSTSPTSITCSSAVKTRAVQICFSLICLVLGAAVQEMLLSFGGAKAPVLALVALYAAFREDDVSPRPGAPRVHSQGWIAIALMAGALEDALNCVPSGCCTLFTLLASTAARFARPFVHGLPPAATGLAAAMVSAPLHELWLAGWGALGPETPLLVRFFASALPAAAAGALLFTILPSLEHHIGYVTPGTEGRLG